MSVARLRSCGMVVIGKVVMYELGMGTTGNNPHHGCLFFSFGPVYILLLHYYSLKIFLKIFGHFSLTCPPSFRVLARRRDFTAWGFICLSELVNL